MESTVSCFADDTRILVRMKNGEDTQVIKNDLHKLLVWEETNNMMQNVTKEIISFYGQELPEENLISLFVGSIINYLH